MKAAIYNGMLTDNVQPLTASCPSGNCSWPLTPSLAVCGGCVPAKYLKTCSGDGVKYSGKNFCAYTMPSGSVANLSVYMGVGFQVMPSTRAHFNNSNLNRVYAANFDVVGAPYKTYAGEGLPPNLVSSECALWMCVQTYNTSMQLGKQVQTVASTFSAHNNYNYIFRPLPADMNPPPVNFSVELIAIDALQSYLASLLNGTVTLFPSTQSYSSDIVQAIWNGTTHIDAWIANLAASMTNVVRVNEPVSRPAYDGTAYQLCYTIRWEWLALPVATVLCSIVLLATVIIETARRPVEAWKASPLTFLLFEVDEEMRTLVEGQTNRYGGIEKAVGTRKVVLEGKVGGVWKFQNT